jgi:hypothetical protein
MAKREKPRAAKATLERPEVVNVPAPNIMAALVSPDEQMAAAAWPAIREFFKGLAGFFTTATALERSAAAKLDRARTLTPPQTAAEDAAIQRFIKEANGDRKQIDDHWTICSRVHGFHRMLTAARDRGANQVVEASAIAQRLHNRYVDDEKRRAAAEQERRRQAAEEQARLDREAELARAEQLAIAREESSPDLSDRESAFVEFILSGNSAIAAARAAGYKDGVTRGPKLLDSPKIQAAIQAQREARAIRRQAEARKAEPLDVQVEEVKPNVTRAAGAVDRKYKRGECLDEAKFRSAAFAGSYGIPQDVFVVDPSKLNEYARSMGALINRWPGVRYVEETKTV